MNITELIDTQYKDYSKYVLFSRAIPHMIDGLKPSQRKIVYTAHKTAKSKRIKTASLSGNTISHANYHHGDASLNDAITKMIQPFANNIPLLSGEGSFGSRLVPEAAAPRYTYAQLSKNFDKYFIDNEVLEQSSDPEDPEPAFYLPVIPWVLVNGIKGIAVGFATEIQPRNPKQLARLCKKHLAGKNISKDKIPPHFPGFRGNIDKDERGWYCEGVYSKPSATKMVITEVPIGYTREKYIDVLDKLEDTNKIVSYVDQCNKEGFKFTVVLKRSNTLTSTKIMTMFRLRTRLNENLTVIDHNHKLRVFDNVNDIIKEFVDYRLSKYTDRYEYLINKGHNDLTLIMAKIRFISNVIDGTLNFKNKNKQQIRDELKSVKDADSTEIIEVLINMPIYSLCQDELDKFKKRGVDLYEEIKVWKNVNYQEEFTKDLTAL